MSLFAGLPAPGPGKKREIEEVLHPESTFSEKRAKIDTDSDEQEGSGSSSGDEDDDNQLPPSPPPPPPPPEEPPIPRGLAPEQIVAALKKIASYISDPSKFAKASSLLRELYAANALEKSNRGDFFDATRAAFRDHALLSQPLLRKEFMKLAASVNQHIETFSRLERSQLNTYILLAFTHYELATDDSFVFNKVMARLKEDIKALPECEPGSTSEDHLLHQVYHPDAQIELEYDQECSTSGQGVVSKDQELDPFGLDAFLPQATELPKKPVKISTAWSAAQSQVMMRQALLECVQAAKAYHKKPWASISVELLIDHIQDNNARFTPSQRALINQLSAFVREQRALRKKGPSAREVNRDSTTFERTWAAWSKVAVSHRGKVGANSESKANNWLG